MGHISLNGARNVRDLGDFVTGDGRKTARGRLLRGDALAALDDSDLAVLDGFGLRTVIDFRGPHEIATYGEDRLPAGASRVSLPITGGDMNAVIGAAVGETGIAEQQRTLGDGKAAQLMIKTNRKFVADPDFRASFGRALRLIADPAAQPVLFHCTAGKDRTGWMAAIVLTVLGVARDAVVADYLSTNDYVWPAYGPWLDRLAESGRLADPALVKPLFYQDAAYLEAAFDEVETRYGTFDRFRTEGLGVTTADLSRLRETLLD